MKLSHTTEVEDKGTNYHYVCEHCKKGTLMGSKPPHVHLLAALPCPRCRVNAHGDLVPEATLPAPHN